MEMRGQLHAPAILLPRKEPPAPSGQEDGRANRSGRGGEEENIQPPPGLEPPIIQPAAECYTIELYNTF
jgi:hypothetical protein